MTSPATGTRSRDASRPTDCVVPGITNIRSSSLSITSTRWRTDAGSLPRPGMRRRLSPLVATLLTAWLLLQVAERVTGVRVPGKALDAVRHQRPTHRGGDRDEQLGVVHPTRRLE